MGFIGSLGTVDKVAARRPLIVVAAAVAEAATGVQACMAIADRAPVAVHSLSPNATLPEGLVRIGVWLLCTLTVSAWLFMTPGWLKFSRAERRRLDDELVIHHRGVAYRTGFAALAVLVLVAAVAAAGGQIIAWWPVAALSAALLVAGGTFSVLEMRDA